MSRRSLDARRELEEVPREQGHVLAPRAQRRDGQRQHVEAVVEVGAERAALARGDEVAVRRRDDAHVHGDGLAAADALDLALLQHAQQLGLHGQRHVAHLVEEERAARRRARTCRAAAWSPP